MDFAALERERLNAIVSADTSALGELLHPDFQLCTPSGDVWTRSVYLEGIRNGSIAYSQFEPQSPIEVLASTALAVVRYLSSIDLVLAAGGGGHLECWHLDVYVRGNGGRWQCVWSQATDTISDALPAI